MTNKNDPSNPIIANKRDSVSTVGLFRPGDALTEFLKLYVLAFVLGTLAGDFASDWMGLLSSNQEPVGMGSLLDEAVRAVEAEFVREYSQQLAVTLDDPYFFGVPFGRLARRETGDWRKGFRDSRPIHFFP